MLVVELLYLTQMVKRYRKGKRERGSGYGRVCVCGGRGCQKTKEYLGNTIDGVRVNEDSFLERF